MFKATSPLVRHLWPVAFPKLAFGSFSRALAIRGQRPLTVRQTTRLASSNRDRADPPPPPPEIDREAERKLANQKLQADPSRVSTQSTTRKAYEQTLGVSGSPDENINDGIKHDLGIVKDAFRLNKIPKESRALGLAGTVPYLATSVSTVYLGWDLTKEIPTGSSFYDAILVNHETAKQLLDVLEPLQLGYGAVIISFLGAIHWGLEYAEKTPLATRTRFRYGMGVAASVVAWPTLLMPIEYGLTSQFMAFVALYFADSRASIHGWAPRWYGQYRFLLTAIVGLAIFVSLVGRSEIEKSKRLSSKYLSSSMNRPGIADTETNWAKVEAEDKKKMKEEEAKKEQQQKEKKKDQEKQKKE